MALVSIHYLHGISTTWHLTYWLSLNDPANIFQPFVIPWFTGVNLACGMLLIGLLFNLPIYLTNTWYSGHLPFNTNRLYDRYGLPFKTKSVVDERGNLDLPKYKSYSVPILMDVLRSSRFTRPPTIRSSLRSSLLRILHLLRMLS